MNEQHLSLHKPAESRKRKGFRPLLIIGVLLLTSILVICVRFAASVVGLNAMNYDSWPANQAAFEAVVPTMPAPPPPGTDWVPFSVPARIGSYDMETTAFRVPQGAIFYDTRGSGFLDDAGIAYLPNGPDPSLENGGFEQPQFEHLAGPWYSWTASW